MVSIKLVDTTLDATFVTDFGASVQEQQVRNVGRGTFTPVSSIGAYSTPLISEYECAEAAFLTGLFVFHLLS